jgi:hypothetical protein
MAGQYAIAAPPLAVPGSPLLAGEKREAPSPDSTSTEVKAAPSRERAILPMAAVHPHVAPAELHPRAAPAEVHPQSAPPEPKLVAAAASTPKAPPPPKGFGYLTVHSSIGYAFVYVQLIRYGHVERRLTVRCGKRFVSLGSPRPTGGEPIWFAPSKTVDVPCGGSLEITMMPKWIP